jgi:hypothetical protein
VSGLSVGYIRSGPLRMDTAVVLQIEISNFDQWEIMGWCPAIVVILRAIAVAIQAVQRSLHL